MPLSAESKDDEKVTAFPPSNDPTHKKANSKRRDHNEI